MHEVEAQEKLRGVSIQAGIESGTPLGASKLIIGKKLKEVKENISKIIDGNNELIIDNGNELTISSGKNKEEFMEADRLNQLLRENPDYLKEFSNDVFDHFTKDSVFKTVRSVEGFNNAEKLFRKNILNSGKDQSVLEGALVQVYKNLKEDYKRRGGESAQLFTHAEKIDTQEFLKQFKEAIADQVAYYSDPKHQNNMFSQYYIDNILPSNETSLAKTLTNIDKAGKTVTLAETASAERENARKEHEIHEQKQEELHKKLFGNGSRSGQNSSQQKTQEERLPSKAEQSSNGMTLDEYIDTFKSIGRTGNPNNYAPEMTPDEYKNFKKMPDGEFRDYIDKLASGTPQDDRKAKFILEDIGFYEANPRKVERFSQRQMDSINRTSPQMDMNSPKTSIEAEKEMDDSYNAVNRSMEKIFHGQRDYSSKIKADMHSLLDPPNFKASSLKQQLETAQKTGYVQGVCECVAAIGGDHALGKKLLSEMHVTKDMAKKFAYPQTYKTLEQGIFAQQPERKLEQNHSIKR